MKRFLLGIALAFLFSSCSSDRDSIPKVYNWADYIDEELIGEFEQWYKEQTGEEVHIVYQTFDINESMLSKIEKGHEDFDVVCPSDYIIERMLGADLLLPIDRDFGETPDYTKNVAPYIIESFNNIIGNGKNANDYSVGYMWGTTGLIYNPKFVTEEEAHTWYTLQNPRYENKIFMKEAFRDVYSSLLVALSREKLDSGEKQWETITLDNSPESIAMVEDFLMKCKNNVAGWEADFGKEYMTQEKGWMNFSWSGDAGWAIQEGKAMGVELRYAVPEEGSTIWFDGWVIPKYAKNVKAARYFINFMCKPENALRNMDAIGYVSAIGGPEILAAKNLPGEFEPEDASYFFGPEDTAVCVNPVQYPDIAIVKRCAMMHDTPGAADILEMWSRVKGDNATDFTYIVIAAALIALVTFAVLSKKSKKNRRKSRK